MRRFLVLPLLTALSLTSAAALAAETTVEENSSGVTGAGRLGFLDGTTATGIEVSWRLDPRDQIGLLLTHGSLSATFVADGGTKVASGTADESLASITARHSFGGSFYLSYGLGVRQISYDITAASAGTIADVGTNSTSAVALVGLGNRWQWGGVTFGVDWADIALPFASWSQARTGVNGAYLADANRFHDDVEALAAREGRRASLELLTISLGYTF